MKTELEETQGAPMQESPKEEEVNKTTEEQSKVEEVQPNQVPPTTEQGVGENQTNQTVEEPKKDAHMDKLNEAYNKISELEDKLIRQNADMVNYRKRKEDEVNKMLKFCNEDLIKDLLPILDNFERAMSTEEEGTPLLDGVKMIYSHLQNVMEKYDVKMIDGANKPFDPVYHNAILVEKREGVPSGMVLEVLQKGYLLKDKVIRTAMVRVSE